MADIYKRASRLKIRFRTSMGFINIEDLWSLPLQAPNNVTSLDSISIALNKQLKNSDDDFSLIDKAKKTDDITQLQFDVVKDIIETRLAERDARENEKAEAERKQKILSVIAEKKDQKLSDMSLEELEKLLENKPDAK